MAVIYITEADSSLHQFRLPADPSVVVTIGREESCVISMPTILGLSGLHCSIACVEGEYVITDEGSSNGTYEGERAISSEPLRAGAVYTIGNAALTFDPEIPVALPAEPEAEAPSSPADASISAESSNDEPDEEEPSPPAPGVSRSKRLLACVLLLAALGSLGGAAWLACSDSYPQAQEEKSHSKEKAGKAKHVDRIACGSRVESIAFSPDGKLLATIPARGGVVQLWDTRTCHPKGKALRHGTAHPWSLDTAVFSPDGKHLVVLCPYGESGNTLYLWDVESRTCIGDTADNKGNFQVVPSPDGAFITCGTSIWDTGDFSQAELAEGSEEVGWSAFPQFSADGRTLLVRMWRDCYLLKVTKK